MVHYKLIGGLILTGVFITAELIQVGISVVAADRGIRLLWKNKKKRRK